MFWSYTPRRDEALQILKQKSKPTCSANGGRLPDNSTGALVEYVSMLQSIHRHMAAEDVVVRYFPRDDKENFQSQRYYEERLHEIYTRALNDSAEVSVGKGRTLLKYLIDRQIQRIENSATIRFLQNGVSNITNIFEVGYQRKIDGAAELMKDFAFARLPNIFKTRKTTNQHTIAVLINAIFNLLGDELRSAIHCRANRTMAKSESKPAEMKPGTLSRMDWQTTETIYESNRRWRKIFRNEF